MTVVAITDTRERRAKNRREFSSMTEARAYAEGNYARMYRVVLIGERDLEYFECGKLVG